MNKKFVIEILDSRGNWDACLAGNTNNEFETEDEALTAIEGLKKLDPADGWTDCEYRVADWSEEEEEEEHDSHE